MTQKQTWFGINSISLLVVILLILWVNRTQGSVNILFQPPPTPSSPTARLLTYTFQLLCVIPPLICSFTAVVLQQIQPKHSLIRWIWASAMLTGAFLINEIYRCHILLLQLGVPKMVTISFYAIIAATYGIIWWRYFLKTPYYILLIGLGLLVLAITMDAQHLPHTGINPLFEGIPKLFSGINLALYFWLVCYQQLVDHS